MIRSRFRHAVVAGGSMAGFLAARVLADHFETVTLVERDRLATEAKARKGVPQGRHIHLLLPRGHAILEGLFPGLTAELRAAGALSIDVGREVAWFHGGGRRAKHDSDLTLLAATRPLLEAHVVRRVRALSNVTLRERTRVAEPVVEGGAVSGVRVVDGEDSGILPAQLLVDATGRGSAMPRWAEALGCGSPAIDTIPTRVTYATCLFPRSGPGPDWRALVVNAAGARRAGFCIAVEGDRWLVTLASLFDEPSPRDHAAFRAFTRSLPVRELSDLIRDLEPLSDVVRYRFPGSLRRRYEDLPGLVPGMIAIGDSVCSFNPVYGQGMTVAAIEAEALGRVLSDVRERVQPDRRLGRDWHRAVARIVDVAWQGVAIEDDRYPEVTSARPAALPFFQWYMERVNRATLRDDEVADRFYRVIGFLDPPRALMRPRMVARVLRASRRG
jgi:2-polyprenyl-6-methoxyphenol hydroxylase-like FAD-dependent oxidoreductase